MSSPLPGWYPDPIDPGERGIGMDRDGPGLSARSENPRAVRAIRTSALPSPTRPLDVSRAWARRGGSSARRTPGAPIRGQFERRADEAGGIDVVHHDVNEHDDDDPSGTDGGWGPRHRSPRRCGHPGCRDEPTDLQRLVHHGGGGFYLAVTVCRGQQPITRYPGSSYLRTDQTCPSLRAAADDGSPSDVVYFGPYTNLREACAQSSRGRPAPYVKVLDTTSLPQSRETC